MSVHSSASCPSTPTAVSPDAAPNPRDRRHREELTLERQHHDDHPGSSRTGARRTPAAPPSLHTPGPHTSPALPPPLEPRLELLLAAMEEKGGGVGTRPGVRKKRGAPRSFYSPRSVYGGRGPPAPLVARPPVFGGESASSADSALAREVSARCTGS